jgi:hypothetical protein
VSVYPMAIRAFESLIGRLSFIDGVCKEFIGIFQQIIYNLEQVTVVRGTPPLDLMDLSRR